MAVCYFNDNYEKKYDCEYEFDSNGITISVNYEIINEVEPDVNGARCLNIDTHFKKRDILIIDSKSKNNYLLKDAYYIGHSENFGTPDGGFSTKFYSDCYFYHKDYDNLIKLLKTPKISKIRIYSNIFNYFIGNPSLFENYIDNEFIIKLKRDTEKQIIKIDSQNIANIILSDNWEHKHDYKLNNINISLDGYAEIELMKKQNYEFLYDYIMELMIYIQLYRPDKLLISKITVCVDDIFYGFSIPLRELNISKRTIQNSVPEDFQTFILRCYTNISYRKANSEIRNIPYIIFNYSRNLEDTFLMLFRAIECYYKKKGQTKSFISNSIINNYNKANNLSKEDIELLTAQILSLRNHYVHSGYFIKNNSLRIKFESLSKRKSNPKNYTDNNVDFKWIYDKTKILYSIVIDIIFRNMLEFHNYNFAKKM